MMQEIIVFVVVAAAALMVGYKGFRSVRSISNPDPCGGCGKSCSGCPIKPDGMKPIR